MPSAGNIMGARIKRPLASFLFLASLFLGGPGSAELMPEEEFKSQEELSDWMCRYYQHREVGLIESALQALERFKLIGQGYPEKDAFIAGFLSEVFKQNPEWVQGWLEQTAAWPYPGAKAIVWTAAMEARHLQAQEAMKEIADKASDEERRFIVGLREAPYFDYLKEPISCPAFVDALWGKFFATGDQRYLIRVISALGLADQIKVWDERALASREAETYLAVYARRYPDVRRICDSRLDLEPENIKKRLKFCLD